MDHSKREFLKRVVFGAGYLGLRSLATGLPISFLANPRKALAMNALSSVAPGAGQYLILSTSGSGDPVNANVPGTYAYSDIIHAPDPSMAATQFNLGAQTVTGAQVWSTLPANVLGRTCFFHHATFTNSHPNEPKVLGLMGETTNHECLPSIFAKALAPSFNTVQTEPLCIGAGQILTFEGRALPNLPPTALASVLATPGGELDQLQALRDQSLDEINGILKQNATLAQRAYVDSLVVSRQQARSISDALLSQLTAIKTNSAPGQVAAAVTLIQMNVAPVMVISIPFGGDNHSDTNLLQHEVPQHQTGVQAIAQLMTTLGQAGLQDKVTFALLNVFGRTLKSQQYVGRTHSANHHAGIIIGSKVRPGVIGGLVPASGDYEAAPIDSTTGLPAPSGGADIPFTDTLGSFAKTLGATLGVPQDVLDANITQGKVVPAALA